MRYTLETIVKLRERGAIQDYAIAGAVASLYYLEPMLTEDIDVLVSITHLEQRGSGLVLLTPIENALAEMGFTERCDVGIRIGDWPVQFLPVASELDEAGLAEAIEIEIDGSPSLKVRVLSPEHIVAKALTVGRAKDLVRIQAFLAEKAVNLDKLKALLQRFNLMSDWSSFCFKSGCPNPFSVT
jgi:hypothetical protein